MLSELAANVLARLFLRGVTGLDALRGRSGMLSFISREAMPSNGGVDGGVSESVLVSEALIPRFSPLLRGLRVGLVLWCARLVVSGSTNGLAAIVFGSTGMGLSGWLVAHCGMLLCLWCVFMLKDCLLSIDTVVWVSVIFV